MLGKIEKNRDVRPCHETRPRRSKTRLETETFETETIPVVGYREIKRTFLPEKRTCMKLYTTAELASIHDVILMGRY